MNALLSGENVTGNQLYRIHMRNRETNHRVEMTRCESDRVAPRRSGSEEVRSHLLSAAGWRCVVIIVLYYRNNEV